MNKKIILFLLISVIYPFNVYAEEKQINLSLNESLELALKNNLDLNIENFSPQFQEINLQKIKDNFGFYAGLETQIRQNISPSSNSFISGATILNQFYQNYNLYLKKKFATGGDLSFRFENSIFNTNSTRTDINPAITPTVSLFFNQPLLKNAFIGSKKITIGENESFSSTLGLKSKAIEIVSRTVNSYWDLVLTIERLKVLESSLNQTKELLRINREKEKAGFLAKIDILSTEANIAAKEESILQQKKQLGLGEENLLKLINPKFDHRKHLNPVDKPEYKSFKVSFEESVKKALEKRPDYQISLIDSKNIDIQNEINSQNRLPDLNLTANAGLQSLNNQYPSAVAKLFDFKTYFWNIGLNFEIPVQGNTGETSYKEGLLNIQKQNVVLENIKLNIISEIRNIVREIEINEKRIEANKLAKRLAEAQIKAEIEKLNLGLSTNYQVLQIQKDFEDASLNEINAIVDYIKSQNNLMQAEGTLLEDNNIVWDSKYDKKE